MSAPGTGRPSPVQSGNPVTGRSMQVIHAGMPLHTHPKSATTPRIAGPRASPPQSGSVNAPAGLSAQQKESGRITPVLPGNLPGRPGNAASSSDLARSSSCLHRGTSQQARPPPTGSHGATGFTWPGNGMGVTSAPATRQTSPKPNPEPRPNAEAGKGAGKSMHVAPGGSLNVPSSTSRTVSPGGAPSTRTNMLVPGQCRSSPRLETGLDPRSASADSIATPSQRAASMQAPARLSAVAEGSMRANQGGDGNWLAGSGLEAVKPPSVSSGASGEGAASSLPSSGQGGRPQTDRRNPHSDTRLQYLESELAQFTAKMEEMRDAATNLQDHVRSSSHQRPEAPQPNLSEVRQPPPRNASPVRAASSTSAGAGKLAGAISSANSLMQSLSFFREGTPSATASTTSMAEEKLFQQLRELRQELRSESEARKQMCSKLEQLVQDEKRQREEALSREGVLRDETASRLEQHWHTMIKEETALRRAVEGHLEARLSAMQREVRLEISSATGQSQQLHTEFLQLRDSLRRELDAQRAEISSSSGDLARLVDQLKNEARNSLDGETPGVDISSSELLTESLVRVEVRRQLAEKDQVLISSGAQGGGLEQAATSQLDRLQTSLENEVTSRQSENSKLLATLHELVAQARQRLEQGQLDLENRLQAKLETTASDARAARQDCREEARQRREALEHEEKEREVVCFMLVNSLEEKIALERKRIEEKIQESMTSHDEQVQRTLEATVGNVVERSTKELLTTRQDLLELREELQDSIRSERDAREQAVSKLSISLTSAPKGEAERRIPQEGQLGLREEIITDLDQVRDELRAEVMARKEDVQGVRSSLDRIREQVGSLQNTAAVPAAASQEQDWPTELARERQAREEADEKSVDTMRELIREERQQRERGYQGLEMRMQSADQTIFVESGKREEKEREILSEVSSIKEEMDTVKRQVTGSLQMRQRLDELQQVQDVTARQVNELTSKEAELGTVSMLPRRSSQGTPHAVSPKQLSPSSSRPMSANHSARGSHAAKPGGDACQAAPGFLRVPASSRPGQFISPCASPHPYPS